MTYSRTMQERRDRAAALGVTYPAFAEYRDALRKDYSETLQSTSRLLTKVVMSGGWPW